MSPDGPLIKDQQTPILQPNQFIVNESVEYSIKSPENEADANLRRRKDWLLFRTFLVGLILITLYCFFLRALKMTPSQDEITWSERTLTAIVSGALGYLIGKRGN